MSCKIYDGFFVKDGDCNSLVSKMEMMAQDVREIQACELMESFFRDFFEDVDWICVKNGNEIDLRKEMSKKIEQFNFRAKVVEEKGLRDFVVDVSCDVVMAEIDGDVLVRCCTERTFLFDKIMSEMNGVLYAYWDNTDRPDDLTEEEWGDRKDKWRKFSKKMERKEFSLYKFGNIKIDLSDVDFSMYKEKFNDERFLSVVEKCYFTRVASRSEKVDIISFFRLKERVRKLMKKEIVKKKMEEIRCKINSTIREINGNMESILIRGSEK